MAMTIHEERHIDTKEVVDVVLPFFRDWFHLDKAHNILSDVDISRMGSGGAVITIQMADMISPEAMKKLDEALAARGVRL